MKTGIIVQARMLSQRFPGKMMAKLNGNPVIDWVLYRLKKVAEAEVLILATSNNVENDILAARATGLDVSVFRGSEDDVLRRFTAAAEKFSLNKVVRVCADNPLVCPGEVGRLIEFFNPGEMDYAFNFVSKMYNKYPDGLGAEITTIEVLKDLDNKVIEDVEREHIFTHLWKHPDQYRIATFRAADEIAFPDIRLDVDTADDLARLNSFSFAIDDPAEVVIKKIRQNGDGR
tara:strand:- start:1569 stop:2261 length:693 start_codon:yes stop_codon:yes gene_type:complete